MQPFYQKYGVQVDDPSKGLMAAQAQQSTNLKSVVDGIESMMKNQEGQIIKANTQQATDLLKQKIQQRGLGVLAAPIDQEAELRGFGNMVNREAIGKTITEQTDLLKNFHINQKSAGADEILMKTGDPIKAREYLKQGLLQAGAPSVFADTEAANYDLRKAAEIKNIAARKTEALAVGSADIEQVATTQGYDAAYKAKNDFIAKLDKKEQPAARKQLDDHLTTISTPDKYDQDQVNNYMKSFDAKADDLIKLTASSVEQENAANRQVLHSQSSDGGGGRRPKSGREGKSYSPNTVDGKSGLPTVDTAQSWANLVTNPIERWSSTNDGVAIRTKHNSVLKAVGDKAVADDIIDTALKTQYKGNGTFGNNFTKNELEEAGKEADRLVAAYLKSTEDYNTAIGTSRSSSSSRLAGKFIDNKKVTDLVSKLAIQRAALYEGLMAEARDKKLRGNNPADPTAASPDRLALKHRELLQLNAPAPNTTPAPTGKTGKGINKTSVRPAEGDYSADGLAKAKAKEDARIDALNLKKGIKPPAPMNGEESPKARLARYAREDAAKNKTTTASTVIPPAPQTTTLTGREQYEKNMADNTKRQKTLENKIKSTAKSEPAPDPNSDKVWVNDPKYGRVKVSKAIAKERYGYKGN